MSLFENQEANHKNANLNSTNKDFMDPSAIDSQTPAETSTHTSHQPRENVSLTELSFSRPRKDGLVAEHQETKTFVPRLPGGNGESQYRAGFFSSLGQSLLAIPRGIGRVMESSLTILLGGNYTERVLRDYQKRLDVINAIEPQLHEFSDEDLFNQTSLFKDRLEQGETLDDLMEEAFAVVREVADRKLGVSKVFVSPTFDPSSLTPENQETFRSAKEALASGATIGSLRLPASFYQEIREQFPESRPPYRMRPFDVQLVGGMVMHSGGIAEMVTGEGKTLAATMPAYLNALSGDNVHIITVNDYLASRDAEKNTPLFEALGMSVGALQRDLRGTARKAPYECDVTYGTNSEFGFDYLRDNMKRSADEQVQSNLDFVIIDEIDSVLIDEARTPLIISGPSAAPEEEVKKAASVVAQLEGRNAAELELLDEGEREQALRECDYTYHRKQGSVALTDRGIDRVEAFLEAPGLYKELSTMWPAFINAALKAHALYQRDRDYVIPEGEDKIVIVDSFTGRLMPGRSWSDGLNQAIEAKEGLSITGENQTLAAVTIQNFFKQYKKLSGMTGTAVTERTEFGDIYDLDVIPIPTNRPLQRLEFDDLVFRTLDEKWNAVVEDVVRTHASGRPVLIGTVSISDSEHLSALLEARGITHQVLNAKEHEREADIVAQAGQFAAVTVATNMAGRGTDIALGSCSQAEVLKHWKAHGLVPASFPEHDDYELLQEELEEYWCRSWGLVEEGETLTREERLERLLHFYQHEGMSPLMLNENVDGLGGLHVIGTERHESRRIDNQLRGRTGRQGDPGSSRFIVSLEDDLMRKFVPEWVSSALGALGMQDGEAITSPLITRRIGAAQQKVEEYHFSIRKNLLEYDEIMNMQRQLIYDLRQGILEETPEELQDRCEELIDSALSSIVDRYIQAEVQDPGTQSHAMRAWAKQLNVSLAHEQWRDASLKDLHSIFVDQFQQQLLDHATPEAFIGSIVSQNIDRLLQCDQFLREPSYRMLADSWENAYLPGDVYTRSLHMTLKRIARKETATIKQEIYEEANAIYGNTSTRSIIDQLFSVSLDVYRGVPAEYDFDEYRIAALGKEIFNVSLSAQRIAEEGNDEPYAMLAVLKEHIIQIYADTDSDKLIKSITDAVVEHALDRSKFPTQWKTDELFSWASALSLHRALPAEGVSESVLTQCRDFMTKHAQDAYKEEASHVTAEALGTLALRLFLDTELSSQENNLLDLASYARKAFGVQTNALALSRMTPDAIKEYLQTACKKNFHTMLALKDEDASTLVLRRLLLESLDLHWKEHLLTLDYLRTSVGLHGYAGKDPKLVYKMEGSKEFQSMTDSYQNETASALLPHLQRVRVAPHTGVSQKPGDRSLPPL